MSKDEKYTPKGSKDDAMIETETIKTADEQTVVYTSTSHDDLEKQRSAAIEEQRDGLPAPIEIPDGGLKAWATVFGAWCMLFSTFGMTNAFGVYQDYYVRVFLTNYSPSTIAWIGSVQLFFMFFTGLATGKLFDAGYFYPMVTIASIVYAFSYYMLSLAHPNQFYQVFLAQGIGAGIGVGFLFLPAVSVIAHHFRRRRSLAMGIVVSGSSCGGLVFPVMLNHLIQSHGFAQATRAVTYLATGLLAVSILSMRTRLPPRSKLPPNANAPPPPSIKGFLTDAKYMVAIGGACLNILGLFTPTFYMQLYAVNHGLNKNLAFYTIAILNGGSFIGRIIPNFIGDHWGAFNALTTSTLACGILAICMLAATNTAGIIAISFLYGLFSGAYISLVGPLFASLADHVSEIGLRMGLLFTLAAFFALAGTPISGALLTENLIWKRPIGFSAGCLFAGFILLMIARSITAKQRKTWKV